MILFSGFFGEQNEFEKEIKMWNIINQFNASLLNGRTFYFLKIIILYVWIFCCCCFIFPFCFSCLFKISENISVYYLFITHLYFSYIVLEVTNIQRKVNDLLKSCLGLLNTFHPSLFAGKAIHAMVAHLDAVTSLAIDPNGIYLMSGSKWCFFLWRKS